MLQSRGSLEELIDDLNACDDEQYFPRPEIANLKQEAWRVRKLIDGYIRYLRQQKNSITGASSVRETALLEADLDDSRFNELR